MKWLLNSAVMASGAYGTYRYSAATQDDLRAFCLEAPAPESRIGYAETAALIERLTGHLPTQDRRPCVLEPGDRAMVVRLKHRVDPTAKGTPTSTRDEDWEIALLERID